MLKPKPKKLNISSNTIRVMTDAQLAAVQAGVPERDSIVYWCPSNTSIQRSCSSCTG